MPTQQPDSTHDSPTQPKAATAELRRSSHGSERAEAKAEDKQPLSPNDPRGRVESPSADRMQGANSQLVPAEADDNATSAEDQEIDTAGTDIDDESPTKAMGTGIAPPRDRG